MSELSASHVAIVAALVAALVGGGGLGGIVAARIAARAASTSKPHEVLTAEQSGFVAFMAEARAEIARLRQRIMECEQRHNEQQAEIERLRGRIAELLGRKVDDI